MARKKREKQSRVVDVFVALVLSLIISYMIVTGIQTSLVSGSYFENLIQYDNKWNWLLDSSDAIRMPVLVVTIALFVVMATMTRKKQSGYRDASDHGVYGNAKFSNLDYVRDDELIAPRNESRWSEKDPLKTLGVSEGIILGRDEDELVIIPPDSSLDNRNVLVVGSSGSAKGQAFVINNILNNKSESFVVTDPKGELFEQTADIKRDQGYKVYQVDFLNLKGSRYNPLDYIFNDIEAIKLATAISLNSAKDVKQDFFFNTARDLLTGLIIYSVSAYEKPNISKTVKGLFNKIADDEEYLSELCSEIGDSHPAYQYFKDTAAATGNTRGSILSSFAQQTGVFSLGDVAKLTEDSDIDFHDLQKQKSILYVKVPVKSNPVPALTATFFDQLITTLYQIGDKNGAILPIPTILMFDEFANLGKINDYDNTLSTCRGYGIAMITIVQDFAQLEEKYSKELARTIINNHDTTLFLRTKDAETAKYFERLAGDTTAHFNTKSTSNSGGWLYILGFGSSNPSKSTNEQYVKKPLIAEAQLLNMNPSDKCYVFMTGHVLELKKAYQSLIYKGFITGVQKEMVNGVKRFPYVYPQHREKYIKKFNLKPEMPTEIKPEKKPVPIVKNSTLIHEESDLSVQPSDIKPTELENEQNLHPSEQKQEKENSDEKIQSIVDSYFQSLNKRSGPKKVMTTSMVEEKSVAQAPLSNDDVDLANIVSEEIIESMEVEESDPAALALIQSVSRIPDRLEESNAKMVNLIDMDQLLNEISLDLPEQQNNDAPVEDDIDELPLG